MRNAFLDALHADGPAPDRAGKAAGQTLRWGFYQTTQDSFLWRGEASADSETNWKRVVEFRAKRI